MNAVCPVFFKLIAMTEQYHPRVALYWELTRYFNFVIFLKLFFFFNLESFRF